MRQTILLVADQLLQLALPLGLGLGRDGADAPLSVWEVAE
jgi:hypothetical protein